MLINDFICMIASGRKEELYMTPATLLAFRLHVWGFILAIIMALFTEIVLVVCGFSQLVNANQHWW